MTKKVLNSIIAIIGLTFLFWVGLNILVESPNNNPFGSKTFVIEEGQGVTQIIDSLKKQGFSSKDFTAKIFVVLSGARKNFKPGEYHLSTDMSLKKIISILTAGKEVRQEISITILEGWKKEEIAEYLESKELFKATDFLKIVEDTPNLDYEILKYKPKSASLEGFLYPDTYKVYVDSTPEEVVRKMLDNFEYKVTSDLLAEVKAQKKDFYHILTLASIVEKEMFGYENRQIVANIFWKRIGDNYPLQSDATVNYITNKGTTRPSIDDTVIENPYNTYQIIGLPPTPISNPSIESIKAVIYPQSTPYYFFLTTPTNEIIFSRNHEEHIMNRNKYLD
ncbi:hypothetical protein A2533_03765 [Candidatus Falkowbacteria bacterium RIFOXYD2_FULL_35_9]|uniref:Endolytic murein transglycosylase n=1 Tax=Candidatus Falkowbacteria bacterium RIFOXYC2_FULL_36_12 TaxID=1798002 RepID=A0A1F5SYY7_9BACT|nr:MAG: hypothetical protein A2478_04205 [Candidatus Falkowbacteria bacterium RIFOXYC2_FULL_36_12]OGF32008.1 MAG: hypothetical protein A2300_02570 [Candidatus Falkowbacteria bacterium RIFOXYB2_FULL_35_7]OGF45946.1 MAG: hypothetical protein A2533_03765 [Candidatus Falkowbacteria bacterium RIFOXYD2_FULL_35_9]